MVEFTTAMGEIVDIPENEVQIVENNPKYQVLAARHNPTGENLMTTRYNRPATPEETREDINPEGGVVVDGDGAGMDDLQYDNPEGDMAMEAFIPVDAKPNPSQIIDWRNLRLQSAISGEGAISTAKGLKDRFFRATEVLTGRKVSVKKSIRESPLLFLVSAKDWYQYINKMTTIDMGAEFAAGVSHAQKYSVALFAMEWENDPGHSGLMARALPDADIPDLIAKGQIAYDILTRGHDILGKRGYGPTNEDKMYKLCFDIIRSMQIRQYNYYSLYSLHPDEGDTIYSEFKSRYIPLSTKEVEMVNEIKFYLETEGDGYAFRTTADESTAIQAAQLMKTAVKSYDIGDTITTQTAIGSLVQYPYNFKPLSMNTTAMSKDSDSLGASKFTKLTFLSMNVPDNTVRDNLIREGVAQKQGKNTIGVYVLGVDDADLNPENKTQLSKNSPKTKLQITPGPTDFTPTHLAIKQGGKKGGGDNPNWTIVDFDKDILRDGSNTQKGKRTRDLNKKLGSPKKNPVGRGKLLHIELWPKTQMTMKRKEPGKGRKKGETLHGTDPKKISYQKWMFGLHKFFPGKQLIQFGTHKRTGIETPYRMRLPTSHFKKVYIEEVGYHTIMPKKEKANKEFIKAYTKFLERYGYPKHAPSKDTYMRFIIPKAERTRSPYYQEMRKAKSLR